MQVESTGKKRLAFSLVELIFVIVVIGILSSVLLTQTFTSKDDAYIAKFRSDLSSIRSAIALYKSNQLLLGTASYPSQLDDVTTAMKNTINPLFSTILQYPIYSTQDNNPQNGKISKSSQTLSVNGNSVEEYNFWIDEQAVLFRYTQVDGLFDCDHDDALCVRISE